MALKTTRNSNLKSTKGNTIRNKNVVSNSNNSRISSSINNSNSNNSSNGNSGRINSSINSSNGNNGRINSNSSNSSSSINNKTSNVNTNTSNTTKSSSSTNTNTSNVNTNTTNTNTSNNINSSSSINTKTSNRNISSGKESFVKKNIKKPFNKFADGNVLKTTNLGANHQDEIGVTTLKAAHNAIVKTKRTAEGVARTAKAITHIPENYRNVKFKIKRDIKKIKRTAKSMNISTRMIHRKLKRGDFRGALKRVPIKKLGKKTIIGAFKLTATGGKIATKATLKGFKKFGRDFKNSAINNKSDETADLGSNAVFATMDTIKQTARIGAKGTRATYKTIKAVPGVYKKIKTLKKNVLTVTKNGAIKTRQIAKGVKNQLSKFKKSKASMKAIKKYIDKLKNMMKDIVRNVLGAIVRNPVVLGVLAGAIIMFILLITVLNLIIGVTASYDIDIENPTQWMDSMSKLDSNISTKLEQYEHVRTIQNSGTKADWRDVIIAYYIKNGNSANLEGSKTSLSGGTTSVDSATWESVFTELKLYLGTAYLYGGSDPSTGFDCSGLVQYCYGKYGITLPRVTTDQVLSGTHVAFEDMKAGDLVFFGTSDDVHHVGVYIGNGEYLHAPQTGDVVKISKLSDRSDFYEARRVFEVKEDSSSSGTNTNSASNTETTDTDAKILYTSLPNNTDLVDIFYKVEKETNVDAILLASIAMQESSLDPNAVSGAGASGLCQFMPATFTGEELGYSLDDIFDPYTNVSACAKYMQQLLAVTNGDLTTALRCYNVGPNAYKYTYGGDVSKMPSETQAYAEGVSSWYEKFSNGEQVPTTMEGSNIKGASSVNTNLAQVYKCFIRFYKEDNDDDDDEEKWILRRYTVEEALDNLGFTEDEKVQFYYLKDFNKDFDDTNQFGGYDVNFKFDF